MYTHAQHMLSFRSGTRMLIFLHTCTNGRVHTHQLAHTLGMHGIKWREEEKNLTHTQYVGRYIPDYYSYPRR